ncbi:hypothetical protein EII15_22585, partial [Bacillus licheniformis]|uniref:hypothetical protein n=1 Tax=Bacillus licheniformis TaxID=1402 RepID=UPI000FA70DE2
MNFGTTENPCYEESLYWTWVYGGKREGKCKTSHITMTGGKVTGIVGGGYGNYSSVGSTLVEMSGGEVEKIYGGGSTQSVVLGSTEVRLTGGMVRMWLVGG